MDKKLFHEAKFENAEGQPFSIQFWTGEVAKVDLIDHPFNALETLARSTRGYLGIYDLDPISPEDMQRLSKEIQETPLATPIEFLNFVFLVRDVPRSFTHQLVRTRIGAAYVQESTRFMGHRGLYKVLVPDSIANSENSYIVQKYLESINCSIACYENIVCKKAIPSQDARQLFPHALLTNLFWSINMKALKTVYNQRWCCCAESSTWLPLLRQVKEQIITACGKEIGGMLTAPIDRGESCGYNSKLLDQPCKWRK